MKSKIKSISRGIAFLGKSIWSGFWKYAIIGSSIGLISLGTAKIIQVALDETESIGWTFAIVFVSSFFVGIGMERVKSYVKTGRIIE